MYPLVGDLAADGVPVAETCRVLGFSQQAYYAWRAQPVTDRDWSDAHLINTAIDIHHDDPEFGDRLITDELVAAGITASRNRVNRLCTAARLWSVHSPKRGPSRRPGPPVHDDLVVRRFAPRRRTCCGSPTSPNTRPLESKPPKASFISARSKTPAAIEPQSTKPGTDPDERFQTPR